MQNLGKGRKYKEFIKGLIFGHRVINFNPYWQKTKGYGFFHKGVEYIHHSTLPLSESAFRRFSTSQKFVLVILFLILAINLLFNLNDFLVGFITALSLFYLIDVLFNFLIISRGIFARADIKVSDEELEKLGEKSLPTYTILCPLYKEAEVIPQFIKAMESLDYPREKLQVVIILEKNDTETWSAINKISLPENFQVLSMRNSIPKTKPKALNYAMKYVKGEYVVVYDAEDIPETDQLKKAVLAFKKASKKIVCIQAKLNFYNSEQNILTRLFTGEYSLLYDFILPGLQSINAPIPLGGTSNHFKTKMLRKINAWDSFNVTEDCDLGIRLFKKGYLTAVVDSTTYEEANSQVKNWLSQRTRWIKGYILTYFVHMRNPMEFIDNNKEIHFLTYQLIIGGKVLNFLLNPIMWSILLLYYIVYPIFGDRIDSLFIDSIAPVTFFTLVFGHTFYVSYYILGLIKRKKYRSVKYAFFVPVYWMMMSIAAYVAVYEVYKRPHAWSKTLHGLHLKYILESEVRRKKEVAVSLS